MATKPEHDEPLAPLLVDVHVACVLLSISRTTLYALIDDGVLRPRKIGRRTLFRVDDLRDFADEAARHAA